MDTDSYFASTFASARQILNLSQAEVVRRMRDLGFENFHASTLGKIERGERGVSVGEAVALSNALGMDLTALLPLPVEKLALYRGLPDDAKTTVLKEWQRLQDSALLDNAKTLEYAARYARIAAIVEAD